MKTKEEIEKKLEEIRRMENSMKKNVENYNSNDFKLIRMEIKTLKWVLDI